MFLHTFGKGQIILTLTLTFMILLTPNILALNYNNYSSANFTFSKSETRHVPPGNAPTLNDSLGWYGIFGNMTPYSGPINFSVPPETDYMALFDKGIVDPDMVIFTVSPATPLRYWRLESYDLFNSHSWSRSNQSKIEKTNFDSIPYGSREFIINMNISHLFVDSRYIPALWPEPRITFLSLNDAFQKTLYLDDYDGIMLDSSYGSQGTSLLTYGVTYVDLDLDYITSNAKTASYTPDDISQRYTQLPNNLSQRVHDFADQFRGKGDNVYETALIVLAYFRTNFTFDMDLFLGNSTDTPPEDGDIVDWFLQRGKGTAAHFATAYVVTLRELGISARPVFGFTPGFQKPGSNVREIKAINIHAWAEVYIPYSESGEGEWLQFDPTPLPEDLKFKDDTVQELNYILEVDVNNTILNRGDPLKISATFYENFKPAEGYLIDFFDQTEGTLLGSKTTNSSGIAEITVTYTDENVAGFHLIVASSNFISNHTAFLLRGNTSLTLSPTSNTTDWDTFFDISGILFDPLNNKGIGYQNISIFFDAIFIGNTTTSEDGSFTLSYYISPFYDLGPHNISAVYWGLSIMQNFTYTVLLNSSHDAKNITVFATPQLSISSNVTSVERGHHLFISGRLMLPNGSSLFNESIYLVWDNGSLIEHNTTSDYFGAFNDTFYVPRNHSLMYATVYAYFISNYSYIRNSTSNILQIRVFLIGTLTMNLLNNTFDHYDQIIISGRLLDDNDNPMPNQSISIIFNYYTVSTTITNSSGYYNVSLTVSASFLGSVRVYATADSPFIDAVTPNNWIYVYANTEIQLLSVSHSFLMPNENLTLNGIVRDDANNPIYGNVGIYLNGTYLTNITASNGIINESIQLPSDQPTGTIIISALFYPQNYYHSSVDNISIYVFDSATITLVIEPNSTYAGDDIHLFGNVIDSHNTPIAQRQILVYLRVSTDPTQDVLLEEFVLNSTGFFEGNVTIPDNVGSGDMALYAVLIGSHNITSQLIIVEVKSVAMQIPGLDQPDYIIIVIFIAVIGIVLYLKRNAILEFLESIKKRKTIKVNIKELMEKLSGFVNVGNYSAAIFVSYQILVQLLADVKGIIKEPTETVREFLYRAAINSGLPVGDVEDFINVYEKARYSADPPDQDDYLQLIQSFARLYQAITGREIKLV